MAKQQDVSLQLALEELLDMELEEDPRSQNLEQLLLSRSSEAEWVYPVLERVNLDFTIEDLAQRQQDYYEYFLATRGKRTSPVKRLKRRAGFIRRARWLAQAYTDMYRELYQKQIYVLHPSIPIERQKSASSILKILATLDYLGLWREDQIRQFVYAVMAYKPMPQGRFYLNTLSSPKCIIDYLRYLADVWLEIENSEADVAARFSGDYYERAAASLLGLILDSLEWAESRLQVELPLIVMNEEATNLYALASPLTPTLKPILRPHRPDWIKAMAELDRIQSRNSRCRLSVRAIKEVIDEQLTELSWFHDSDQAKIALCFLDERECNAVFKWYGRLKESWTS